MTVARAIQLDERYAHPTVLGFGDGVEPIETIRARYREQGPMRLKGKFTAKQRDLLGVLRSAGRPVSFKEMFLALGALPRTWIGYDSQGLSMTLERLAARGLCEKIPAPPSPRKMAPKVLWRITDQAVEAEQLAPVKELGGVGPETGAHYLNRKAAQRRPRTQTRRLRVVPPPQDTAERTDTDQAELDALIQEQERQQRFDKFGRPGERPRGSPSIYQHKWMRSLDQPKAKDDDRAPSRQVSLHDVALCKQEDVPHEAVLEQERREIMADILGDLREEDIDQLSDATLDHLRSRLSEEGVVGISVMGHERERLRIPDRHRGHAPPAPMGKKSGSHRGRKESSELMGKRQARKARKRWARESGEW